MERCQKNRRIRLVDGTTLTMPNAEANPAAFPQQSGQKAGLGFRMYREVGITYLFSRPVLHAAVDRFKGKGSDEQILLCSIKSTLEKGDVLWGDALYPTYFFIARMLPQGVDIFMEQKAARVALI